MADNLNYDKKLFPAANAEDLTPQQRKAAEEYNRLLANDKKKDASKPPGNPGPVPPMPGNTPPPPMPGHLPPPDMAPGSRYPGAGRYKFGE